MSLRRRSLKNTEILEKEDLMDDDPSQDSQQKRTGNACLRCRKRKVKCSGQKPCENCTRRSLDCVFEVEEKKIVVAESYINELKRKAEASGDVVLGNKGKRMRVAHSAGREEPFLETRGDSHDGFLMPTLATRDVSSTPITENDLGISNPLASEHSSYLVDQSGTPHFLGPTSPWSFSRQVFSAIQCSTRFENLDIPQGIPNVDGTAYDLASIYPGSKIVRDISSMPSLDYAIYLTNTVKFHLGQMSHLFDEENFMSNLHRFYENEAERENTASLWYIQFLLVIAFGKAFLVRTKAAIGMPIPGSEYFIRAMKVLPDVMGLYQDPVLAIEILCLVSLYFHCADLRNVAYSYIGQALRMAISQGLHKEMPNDQQEEKISQRRRNIWWTVYNIDMKFSTLLGVPESTMQKENITLRLPSSKDTSHRAAALRFDVKLSRLTAHVINTVYETNGRLQAAFLKRTQLVLRSMADLAKEIEEVFVLKANCAVTGISRVVANVHLLYQQCIILAIRPLLLRLLEIQLQRSGRPVGVDGRLSESVKALLQTCVNSTRKILGIQLALRDHNLLESFLPFDLEYTFSAGFVLIMISAILPSSNLGRAYNDLTYRESVTVILDDMILKGSVPAKFRKEELEELDRMFGLLLQKEQAVDIPDNAPLDGSDHQEVERDTQIPPTQPQALDFTNSTIENYVDWGPEWPSLDESHFLSPENMLSVANMLGPGALTNEFELSSQDGWLYEDIGLSGS